MLSTVLIVVLILLLIGALPTWGYSSGWGYGPGGILGLILIIVVILALMGRLWRDAERLSFRQGRFYAGLRVASSLAGHSEGRRIRSPPFGTMLGGPRFPNALIPSFIWLRCGQPRSTMVIDKHGRDRRTPETKQKQQHDFSLIDDRCAKCGMTRHVWEATHAPCPGKAYVADPRRPLKRRASRMTRAND